MNFKMKLTHQQVEAHFRDAAKILLRPGFFIAIRACFFYRPAVQRLRTK